MYNTINCLIQLLVVFFKDRKHHFPPSVTFPVKSTSVLWIQFVPVWSSAVSPFTSVSWFCSDLNPELKTITVSKWDPSEPSESRSSVAACSHTSIHTLYTSTVTEYFCSEVSEYWRQVHCCVRRRQVTCRRRRGGRHGNSCGSGRAEPRSSLNKQKQQDCKQQRHSKQEQPIRGLLLSDRTVTSHGSHETHLSNFVSRSNNIPLTSTISGEHPEMGRIRTPTCRWNHVQVLKNTFRN